MDPALLDAAEPVMLLPCRAAESFPHATCGHGLVPCSGALLILVYALVNGIIVAGVLMTLAIAVGMGLTLAALGIGSIYMRRGAVRRHAVIGGLRAP